MPPKRKHSAEDATGTSTASDLADLTEEKSNKRPAAAAVSEPTDNSHGKELELSGLNALIEALQIDIPIGVMNACIRKQLIDDEKCWARGLPNKCCAGIEYIGRLSMTCVTRICQHYKYGTRKVDVLKSAMNDGLNAFDSLDKSKLYICYGYDFNTSCDGHYVAIRDGLIIDDRKDVSNVREVSAVNIRHFFPGESTVVNVLEIFKYCK